MTRKYGTDKKEKRRSQPTFKRPSPFKEEIPTILIVCEGRNTEPSYFRHFRLLTAVIKTIGAGRSTLSLINEAIRLREERNYDQVWCVFDADPMAANHNHAKNFNEAIKKAALNNIQVAYSNQAFEYWLILHFEDHQGGKIPRSDYHKKINKHLSPLKQQYEGKKGKSISKELFEVLQDKDPKSNKTRQQLAIDRAKKIYSALTHQNPAEEESSTTVYKLVEILQKHCKI